MDYIHCNQHLGIEQYTNSHGISNMVCINLTILS